MYNESFRQFLDSSKRAGYPYSVEISVQLDGRVDYLEYRSFKTMREAWYFVAKMGGEIWKDFPAELGALCMMGSIWKAGKPFYDSFEHDLICNVGSWDRGKWRNMTYIREVNGERIYDTVRYR